MKATELILICIFAFIAHTSFGQKVGLEIGDKAPQIIEKAKGGKHVNLYSLQGQMVLIDFWASWCKPCRAENPNIVMAYKKYMNSSFKNGKGFTVFSVSLDKRTKMWKKAIIDDEMIWDNHVIGLKGWQSLSTQLYKVHSIPTNYLIDGSGTIVAKNLRGKALEKTLDKLLN